MLDQISQHLETFRPEVQLAVGAAQAQTFKIEGEGRKLERSACHLHYRETPSAQPELSP
jgi:hypothetical protein